ncbi:Uncharacterised protein [Candidatus Anstonella stagnisolia]|nr:Uncharacterised protein [Candidatus Anstonella stagnisolia]
MRKIFPALFLLALAAGCVQQQNFGAFGSTHEHADFKMYVNGQALDFSQAKYQEPLGPNGTDTNCTNESTLAHLHGGDGDVVHKHATGVTWGYFFSTIGINLTDNCIVLDNGTAFCNSENGKWRYFVNGRETGAVRDTEIKNLDRVLITYGANDAQISGQLASVTSKAAAESTNGACGSGNSSTNVTGAFDKDAIAQEYFRLEGIAQQRNLTAKDLGMLGNLTSENGKLSDAYNEALWMQEHNYTHHMEHALGAVYYIATEGSWACPADPLSHVGIFLEANESKMAADSIAEGRDALAQWEPKAVAMKAQNPDTYPGLGNMLSVMKKEISDFMAGDYEGAKQGAKYLEQNGYC